MLESKLPHMQQKLGLQNGIAHERQSSHVQHSLVGRVEALEEAVEVLIIAQVRAAIYDTPPMADYVSMPAIATRVLACDMSRLSLFAELRSHN